MQTSPAFFKMGINSVPFNTTNVGTGQEGKHEKYENKFMMIALPVGGRMCMPEHSTHQIKKGR
jgi:hypothetical protein